MKSNEDFERRLARLGDRFDQLMLDERPTPPLFPPVEHSQIVWLSCGAAFGAVVATLWCSMVYGLI